MPFDGSGAYSLPAGSTAVTGATILASVHNTPIEDIATALSACMLRSGVAAMTGDLNMNSNKIEGLAAGDAAGDAVRYEQVVLLSAGANQTITRSATGTALTLESTADGSTTGGPDLVLFRNGANSEDGDLGGSIYFDHDDSGGTQTTFARIHMVADDFTDATEDGSLHFSLRTAGTLADELTLTGANLYPTTNDGLALGLSGNAFADAFFASGAVLNFNAGGYTVTHSVSNLAFSGTASFGGAITVSAAQPLLILTDTDTGSDCRVSGNSNGGTLVLEADINNEVSGSKIQFNVDGSEKASIDTNGAFSITSIELGHASQNTLTASGGDLSIEGNRIFRVGGADVPLADGGTGASLTDPNADRIMFWDDSESKVDWLAAGTHLSISGTSMSVSTGTSGAAIPLLNGNNTHSGNLTVSGTFSASGTATLGDGSGDTVTIKGTELNSAVSGLFNSASVAALADTLLDALGTEVHGAIVWHNGTSWTVLEPPTSGDLYALYFDNATNNISWVAA